jgi:NAD+ diphosphatase
MNFIKTTIEPESVPDRAYYFIFSDNAVLVEKKSELLVSIPCIKRKSAEQMGLDRVCFFGRYQKISCYCAGIRDRDVPEQYELIPLRSLYGKIDHGFWGISGYARQIHDWNMNFTFCGRCGEKTTKKKNEHARVCADCGLASYPRISPAMITAVVKEDEILLARGVNFPNKKMFSVLAGFVEPGESLEDCVAREVFEETGIRIRQIQYFNSQPWPFPDSLMIGFTAVYDSGSLSIDAEEILEAGWFKADRLPIVPKAYTLAGELIRWFVKHQGRDGAGI